MSTADKPKNTEMNYLQIQINSQQSEAATIALELFNLEQRKTMLMDRMRTIKGGMDQLEVLQQNENDNKKV